MTCPTLEELLAAALTRDSSPAGAEAWRHTLGCPACAAAARWIEDVLAAVAVGSLPDVPEASIEAAAGIPARASGGVGRPGLTILERVRAAVSGPLPAGVRGPAAAASRRLYSGGDAELDLEVTAVAGAAAVRLTGQLLLSARPPPAGVLASLWSGERWIAAAEGDAAGIFVLPDVPRAVYRLAVWAPAEARGVEVDPLDLCVEAT